MEAQRPCGADQEGLVRLKVVRLAGAGKAGVRREESQGGDSSSPWRLRLVLQSSLVLGTRWAAAALRDALLTWTQLAAPFVSLTRSLSRLREGQGMNDLRTTRDKEQQ